MKTSKLNNLIKVIKILVEKEVKKQLSEEIKIVLNNIDKENKKQISEKIVDNKNNEISLKEMFFNNDSNDSNDSNDDIKDDSTNKIKKSFINNILNEIKQNKQYMIGTNDVPLVSQEDIPFFKETMNESKIETPSKSHISNENLSDKINSLSSVPNNVSILDVLQKGMLPKESTVANVLTNYSHMKRVLEESKKKRH